MKRVNNISGVVIPFWKTDPAQIFIEIKDNTHPLKLVRGGLCPIGGNWIGPAAVADANPLATVRREVVEEMTLESGPVSTQALVELGLTSMAQDYAVCRSQGLVSVLDEKMLREVVSAIVEGMSPFGSYLNTTTRAAILSADPTSTREGFTTLSCYYTSAMDNRVWEMLNQLQRKFNNLSNESITLVTSLDEVLTCGLSGAFAHEQPLRDFFLAMGLKHAKHMRIVPGQTSVYVGPPLASYADYLELYDVAKKPIG